MEKLTGKTAVVTGGAKGIGRAIVLELAKRGAKVIINYNGSHEAALETKKLADELGFEKAEILKCNVSDFAEAKKMIDEIVESYGSVDILVNNAGITKDNLLMKMSEEQFDEVINVNLKGCFNTMQAVSKYMIKKRYGRIINISSVSGVLGNVGQTNYAASKAGIIGLTKAAARELATRGITVNAIAPGFVNTDMTKVLSDSVKESIGANIPMKSFGEPEDIAYAVSFLAGDEARYITGQTLSVDGGMSMK